MLLSLVNRLERRQCRDIVGFYRPLPAGRDGAIASAARGFGRLRHQLLSRLCRAGEKISPAHSGGARSIDGPARCAVRNCRPMPMRRPSGRGL